MLAISHQWQKAVKERSFSDQKRLAKTITLLYEETERDYDMIHAEAGMLGAPNDFMQKFIAHYFPDSGGDLSLLREQLGLSDEPSVVLIPATKSEGNPIVEAIFREIGCDPIPFSGIAATNQKLAFVWGDSSVRTEIHERTHIEYAGLLVGGLMGGLDEGMTEYLTHEEIGYGSLAVELRSVGRYGNQLRMFTDMENAHPGIIDLIRRRYTEGTSDSSNQLYTEIINRYGLDGLLDLAMVHPYVRSLETNDAGYISSEDFVNRQGIPPQNFYDTMN